MHFDVMDGSFVEQITFGVQMLKAVKARTKLPLDVHLMVTNPQDKIKSFAEAGAEYISFHIEALNGSLLERQQRATAILQDIQKYGVKAGIVLNPKTEVEDIFPVVQYCDFVLVMSVQAGLGGQKFIASTLQKADRLAEFIKENQLNVILEMDGGITTENAKAVRQAGVSMLVAGSSIFQAEDRRQAIENLRNG